MHQCTRCGTVYSDDSRQIMDGCSCGGKLFFYMKTKQTKLAEQLSDDQKQELEEEIADAVGHDVDEDEPLVIDLESVRSTKQGYYEIDVQRLLKEKPLIYKLSEGHYLVDLMQAFEQLKKKK